MYLKSKSTSRRRFFNMCNYFMLSLIWPALCFKKKNPYLKQVILISANNRSFSSYSDFKFNVWKKIVGNNLHKFDSVLTILKKQGYIIKENYSVNKNKVLIERLWSNELSWKKWVTSFNRKDVLKLFKKHHLHLTETLQKIG